MQQMFQMKTENGDEAVDQATEDELLAIKDEPESENADYLKLIEYGIAKTVAKELIKIYETGKWLN